MLRMVLRIVLSAGLVLGMALPAVAVDTVGVVDVGNGHWTLRAENGNSQTIGYGVPRDVPFMGDWDCDGVDTPGLYRQSDGFAYLRNSNTTGVADITFLFGIPGDVPLIGDFNGDGCDTLSIYRPGEARFYIINRLGENGGGLGAADYFFDYGVPGDVPFVGDWDGDGIDTPGLRRVSNGFVYLRHTNTTGVADVSYFYGVEGDVPFAGDWDGDGVDTLGLFRPSNATFYLRNSNTTGVAHQTIPLGSGDSKPVSGDFDLDLPPPPPPLALETVASGLDRPLYVAAPPGDDRLFVVEQGGDIEIISGGSVLASPFLDLGVTAGGERGLLGLAFHPDYAANGKFYVNYNIGLSTRISEFTVSANENVADPSSERILLQLTQPRANHNGGSLIFDENGYLVIALGDGGDGGFRSRDPYQLLGKLLRIDVDAPSGGKEYGIPPSNPFAAGGGASEVYMLGLRNPWRIDIDGGYMYIADVGQSQREEVTVVAASAAGADLGWNMWEGTRCYQGSCSVTGLVFPQVEYTHAEGCSITGGLVYRGADIPGLQGHYFYGDLCGGWIKSFRYSQSVVGNHVDRGAELGTVAPLTSFGYDGSGEIYVTSFQGGRVFKLVIAP